MRRMATVLLLMAGATAWTSAGTAGQTGTTNVTLTKAALADEVKTDQRQMIVPTPGQKFLWVSATLSGAAATIDLTKIAVTSGAASFPLVGIDSVYDGDPNQFSMIAKMKMKDGGTMRDPLEETRSDGSIAFAFSPGKVATLKAITPPASFCLLFGVPPGFATGQVKGLGAKDLAVPPLGK